MSSDIFGNFVCLDELIQIIYQGAHRFVVLSTVSDQWTIHLGLAGPEGRWWRGGWTKRDVLQIIGSTPSDKLLESFAEKLAESLVQGEIFIENWSTEKDLSIKLTFGPSSKKPLHISLVEISQVEAASHATDVFLDIALHAKSRKYRLHPDEYTTQYAPSSLNAGSLNTRQPPVASSSASTKNANDDLVRANVKAREEIQALKVELEKLPSTSAVGSPLKDKPAAQKPPKGASLANPNKKARKYQAIEFGSDDE